MAPALPAQPRAESAHFLRCLFLGGWLLLPTLAAAWIMPGGAAQKCATVLFGLWLLALPLILLGSARRLFLFWSPVAMLAPLQLYLIYFFRSVPGDAVIASTFHLSTGQLLELLTGFGWLPLLVPASWVAYWLTWRRLPPDVQLSTERRKVLAAALLTYAMIGMQAHRTLKHYVDMPSLFNEIVAGSTYPAGTALSMARVFSSRFDPPVKMDRLGASAQARDMLVILVIGESARPDHFGVNGYPRDTTPRLNQLGPELLSFRDVATTANFTYAALPNLVSGTLAGRRVSLVSVFREAGFHTSWYSNQWSTLYVPGADINEFADDDQTYRLDSDLLPRLASCLHQCGARQLNVLHTYGSHFPYDERYRAADAVYRPIFRDAALTTPAPEFRRELINSYDNSLRETDRLIAATIELARSAGQPALVIYTSDHGENLYDDERKLFLHLGQATRADTLVPLLVWASPEYRRAYPAKMQALLSASLLPISHEAVLPTILDLAGISYPQRDASRSFASPGFRPRPRIVEMGEGTKVDFKQLR